MALIGRDDLQVVVRALPADLGDDLHAVSLEVIGERLQERRAELVTGAARASKGVA